MKFDHENPKDIIFIDISLIIMLDIPLAFSAHHLLASLLSVDEHPFKHPLMKKNVSFQRLSK